MLIFALTISSCSNNNSGTATTEIQETTATVPVSEGDGDKTFDLPPEIIASDEIIDADLFSGSKLTPLNENDVITESAISAFKKLMEDFVGSITE